MSIVKEIEAVSKALVSSYYDMDMTREKALEARDYLLRKWDREWHDQPDGAALLYGHRLYLAEAYQCWCFWSNPSATKAIKWFTSNLAEPWLAGKTIVDLGAGIGGTTAQLASGLPDARVVYHNIQGPQWDIADALFASLNLTALMTESPVVADVVFASEYMEHIEDPVTEVRTWCADPRVAVYFDVSSFTSPGPGHYRTFRVNGEQIENKRIRRVFNAEMRRLGFKPAHDVLDVKPFWNNRPAVWVRPDLVTEPQPQETATA